MYDEDIKLTSGSALDVMKAAMKFQIPQLIKKCFDFIVKSLSIDNVCDTISFSIECANEDLADKCVSYISMNAANVLKADGFQRLSRDALIRVLQNDYLKGVSETDVFKACVKWADRTCQCKQLALTDANRRNVLGEAIYQVRFTSFTPEEFFELTEESEILTPAEQLMFCRIHMTRKELPKSTQFNRHERKRWDNGEFIPRYLKAL